MIRFILKETTQRGDGAVHERLYTIDAQVKELETALCQGGSDANSAAYEFHALMGCEILNR